MCVTFYGRGTEKESYSVHVADPSACLPENARNSIDQLVGRALSYLNERALLALLVPEWNEGEQPAGNLSDRENSRILCGAVLRSLLFRSTVLPRIYEELEREGLACPDCPRVDRGAVRDIPLDLFMRYVGAYAWPDIVRPELGKDGQPTGKGSYAFYTCVGINGLSTIVPMEPEIAAAAWAVIRGLDAFYRSMNRHYSDIFAEEGFRALASLAGGPERFSSETEYLRAQLPARVAADPGLRAEVCGRLEEPHYEEVLRLKVAECAPSAR